MFDSNEGEEASSLVTGVIVSTRPQFYRLSIWTRLAPSGQPDDDKLRERIEFKMINSPKDVPTLYGVSRNVAPSVDARGSKPSYVARSITMGCYIRMDVMQKYY